VNAYPTANIDTISYAEAKYGTTIIFEGYGEDVDGNITEYAWYSSIDGKLSSENYFLDDTLSPGHHQISFMVKDDYDDWSEANQTALWIYTHPIADAGEDFSAFAGEEIQFAGTGTDEDGMIVKYEWDFNNDGIFDWSSTENGNATWTFEKAGTFNAKLQVTDCDNFTSSNFVKVTVDEARNIDPENGFIPAFSLIWTLGVIVIVVLRRHK